MRYKLAENSGFCFGVEKAISKSFEELKKTDKKIYSLGPIIHNQQVTYELFLKGLTIIESIKEIEDGTVIIRSHGVSKSIYDEIDKKNLNIVDTTCPFVKRIQTIVHEHYNKNYKIIIVGDKNHPEVLGINGWCEDNAIVINNLDELYSLNLNNLDKVCIVAQTTIPLEKFETISNEIEKISNEFKSFDTTCFATKERQNSAKKLAKEVDAMVVVGGKNSSNTNKLVEICNHYNNNNTYHVEVAEELNISELKQYELIGITAGASTPKWVIDDVINFIKKI